MYVPDTTGLGVNVAVGFDVLENWLVEVEPPPGAVTTDQAPVPLDGPFAPSVAPGLDVHSVWSLPAAAVVGVALNVITTSSVEAGQGAVGVIVHRKV